MPPLVYFGLLKELFDNKEVLYLHCYGGHGRAGTVASLLLAVIYDLQPDDAMEYVQKYHAKDFRGVFSRIK